MGKKDVFYYTKKNIIFISTTIVFICLFIFAMVTRFLYTSRVFNNVDRDILHQKDMIEHSLPMIMKEKNKDLLDGKFHFNPPLVPPNITAIIYFQERLEFVSPSAYFTNTNVPKMEKLTENKIITLNYKGHKFRALSFVYRQYNIQLFTNIDSQIQSINQLNNSIILSLIVLIIIALLLSSFLGKKIIKPVKEAYDKQVFFVQDASHEMRTPLAVIKGKLELLANSWGESIDNNFEYISKMMSEIKLLEKLNSDLLLLTKEDLSNNIKIDSINLEEFIKNISEFYIDLAEIQNKKFEVIRPNGIIKVSWDYDKIKRIIVILLENAFKYTKVKDSITIVFEEFNKNIKITIKDTGIGIKKEDQRRIFDRFFRSSNVRASNITGSGIGLSLLKSISNSLGIEVNFSSEVNIGTKFQLIVPKVIRIK
ncbi:sensor histidine kinase [Clostridium rectalis]|uniref:sensor histidine kinase n=1 Tax=Clostridium rectalis TaxID=2040295 RepID=UPI000F644E4A|nr:HAMP domain-containing sensor histidine kinase [Clostridium rectalis]